MVFLVKLSYLECHFKGNAITWDMVSSARPTLYLKMLLVPIGVKKFYQIPYIAQ